MVLNLRSLLLRGLACGALLALGCGGSVTTSERDPEITPAPPKHLASGAYFFVADIEQPLSTQMQLFAWIDVDPETGEHVTAFVNADRNRDPARCEPFGLTCNETEACRTLPQPACVVPSEKVAGADEYPDYLPNDEPPTGYSFQTTGQVDGESAVADVFVHEPVDIEIVTPSVKIQGTVMTVTFEKDENGVLRGEGTFAAEQLFLGSVESIPPTGLVRARLIPPGEVPPGLEKPVP